MTDVIVIGAGHNGLVTAAYLAKAGLKVTIVEAAPQVGGAAVTREFAPGYKVSGVAHLLHGLNPTIARDLDLARHGLDLKAACIATRSLLADGRNLEVGPDMAASAASIAGISKADAEVYPAVMARLTRMADALASYALNTPPRPDVAKMDWREKLNLGKFAWSLRRLGKKDMLELTRILTMNVNDLANDYFESHAVKGLLCFEGSLGLFLGPRSPSTVFNLLYRLSNLGANGQGGFLLPKGGMGSVTQALAKAAQAAGVTIRTSAAVDHILIENDVAAGVVLANGEELRAGRVVSNADPQRTALQLIGPRNLDAMFVSRIRHLRMNGCAAKIHLALDGLPDALTGARGRIVVAQKPDDIERAYDCAKYGRVSDRPALEMVIPTLTDASLAPAGKHVASIVAQYCPYKLKDLTQHEARRQIGERTLKVLEEVAPGISQRVTATEILTPYDLEAQFGMTGGQWHHGEITLDQVLFLRPAGQAQEYRMPVPGVYLCGAGAHPGGNISGAPGYNAAREILKDVRARRAA
ncbi:MAG TPA: NAD(P)/FAD-dependent oxidoreductase [Dongiaceae bacterium]|nr:NAD(P)/FAD-dependent oxidoreductase [Dongiaceae bacterium]